MELQMMSLSLQTGYKCKNCNGNVCGYYVWMEKMYFRGMCNCSYWLVRSTKLQETFNSENIHILS